MQTQQRRRGTTIRDTKDERSSGYSGNLFCDESLVTPMKCYWPKELDRKKEAVTTFRLLPEPDPDKPGTFLHGRASDEAGDFTGWITRYLAWRGAGEPATTFFLYDPEDPQYKGRNRREIEFEMPACMLSLAIAQAKKAGKGKARWFALAEGSKGRGAIIKRPNWMYLAYAAIYEHGPDGDHWEAPLGLGRKDKPILLDLGSDVGQSVLSLCNKRREEYHDSDPEPYAPFASVYEIGNPVSPKNGVFIRAFPMKTKDPRKAERLGPNPPRIINLPEPEDDEREKTMGFNVYAVESPYKGHAIGLGGRGAELWDSLKPFSSVENGGVLKFPTIEEQIAILSRIVVWDGKPCLDLLEYAWSLKHQEWVDMIPEKAWDLFRAKRVVAPRADYDDDEEDEGDEDEATSRESTRRKARSRPSAAEDDEDEDEEESTPRNGKSSRKTLPTAVADEDDDEDDEAPPPARNRKAKAKPTRPVDDEDDEDDDASPDVDEDEDEAPPPPRSRKQGKVDRSVPSTVIPDDDDDEDDKADVDEDEDEDEAPPPAKNGKANGTESATAEEPEAFEQKPAKAGGKAALEALKKVRLKGKK